jgi:hypothetical protein
MIPNGSELTGHAHLIIIRISRGVSEAVVIAHAQGSKLAHEVLIPRTEVVVLIIMPGEVVELILRGKRSVIRIYLTSRRR